MKKIILLFSVISLLFGSFFVFAACGAAVIVPGTAWANKETLTYDIFKDYEAADPERIGELTVITEVLAAGNHYLSSVRDEAFKITSSSTQGMRYIQEAKDLEGNVILYSESIMNGFISLASYKTINFNGVNFESKAYLSGRNYNYNLDGKGWKKIKTKKSGFIDNELLYAWLRVYDEIDESYAPAVQVIDPRTASKESFSVSAGPIDDRFALHYTPLGSETVMENVKCVRAVFQKSSVPQGKEIVVWYSAKSFRLQGDIKISAYNESYHIPVKIIENEITYILTNAQAW